MASRAAPWAAWEPRLLWGDTGNAPERDCSAVGRREQGLIPGPEGAVQPRGPGGQRRLRPPRHCVHSGWNWGRGQKRSCRSPSPSPCHLMPPPFPPHVPPGGGHSEAGGHPGSRGPAGSHQRLRDPRGAPGRTASHLLSLFPATSWSSRAVSPAAAGPVRPSPHSGKAAFSTALAAQGCRC